MNISKTIRDKHNCHNHNKILYPQINYYTGVLLKNKVMLNLIDVMLNCHFEKKIQKIK